MRDIERDNEVCRLLGEGWTLRAVGDHFGITRQRVYQIACEGGVVPMSREVRRGRILGLWVGGMSSGGIAVEMGIGRQQVLRVLRGGGIRVREETRREVLLRERDRGIVEAFVGGESRASIARRIGLSPMQVGRVVGRDNAVKMTRVKLGEG